MTNKRLFTFGCSFTKYMWVTWADIIGRTFEYYENWGQPGAGNQFIFNSVIEANTRHNFTKDDTIAIMWSSYFRQDFYGLTWQTPGGTLDMGSYAILNPVTSEELVKNNNNIMITDLINSSRGYYIRDLASMTAIRLLLDNIGCKYYFLSMVDMVRPSMLSGMPDEDVAILYSKTLDIIRPSFHKSIYNYKWVQLWPKRKHVHPIPSKHLEFVVKILPEFSLPNDIHTWIKYQDETVLGIGKDINKDITQIKRL